MFNNDLQYRSFALLKICTCNFAAEKYDFYLK